ncbi:hypothetical protein JIN84_18055 [Luteolibacter yonseiensis]|uniref:Uncharacterized protein n=1 Tax=Luteolibacter yonseiensis TaxID=1144680 RepID=A0A934R8Q6_9BACT|nr:hypothetical protein [Luteolibacter yonseiensis]MBK1817530.1 hypothetical protein [Luteolibacter yonseiensis]
MNTNGTDEDKTVLNVSLETKLHRRLEKFAQAEGLSLEAWSKRVLEEHAEGLKMFDGARRRGGLHVFKPPHVLPDPK